MQKKYIVRLTDEERRELQDVVAQLRGGSQKARRARILLQADADGPAWTDTRIAEAFACRRQTVENLRQRFVESGFREALDGKRRLSVDLLRQGGIFRQHEDSRRHEFVPQPGLQPRDQPRPGLRRVPSYRDCDST